MGRDAPGERSGVAPIAAIRATSLEERAMGNPLESISGTIVCGLVLTAVLVVVVRMFLV
jgi:hypothetical protein